MIKIESHANDPIEIDLLTLENANLDSLNLHRALLCGTNLSGASLVKTNLRSAELEGANLSYTNLTEAELMTAWIQNANPDNVFSIEVMEVLASSFIGRNIPLNVLKNNDDDDI